MIFKISAPNIKTAENWSLGHLEHIDKSFYSLRVLPSQPRHHAMILGNDLDVFLLKIEARENINSSYLLLAKQRKYRFGRA